VTSCTGPVAVTDCPALLINPLSTANFWSPSPPINGFLSPFLRARTIKLFTSFAVFAPIAAVTASMSGGPGLRGRPRFLGTAGSAALAPF